MSDLLNPVANRSVEEVGAEERERRARKFLHAQLHDLLKQWKRFHQKTDVRSVHQVRVISRRLQAALAPFGGNKLARNAGKQVRKAAKRLGTLRDLDVAITYFRKLQRNCRDGEVALAAEEMFFNASKRRRECSIKQLKQLSKRKLEKTLGKLLKVVDDGKLQWQEKASRQEILHERWEALLAASNRLNKQPDIEEAMHALRIALKKYRYTVEIQNRLAGVTPGQGLGQFKKLQIRLGDWHDRVVFAQQTDAARESLEKQGRNLFAKRMQSLLERINGQKAKLRNTILEENLPASFEEWLRISPEQPT